MSRTSVIGDGKVVTKHVPWLKKGEIEIKENGDRQLRVLPAATIPMHSVRGSRPAGLCQGSATEADATHFVVVPSRDRWEVGW